MQQAIEQGGDEDWVGKEITPVRLRFIVGENNAAFLVAARNELEGKLCHPFVQREEAHLIEYEQLGTPQGLGP